MTVLEMQLAVEQRMGIFCCVLAVFLKQGFAV
jgi:hypothetical protein